MDDSTNKGRRRLTLAAILIMLAWLAWFPFPGQADSGPVRSLAIDGE